MRIVETTAAIAMTASPTMYRPTGRLGTSPGAARSTNRSALAVASSPTPLWGLSLEMVLSRRSFTLVSAELEGHLSTPNDRMNSRNLLLETTPVSQTNPVVARGFLGNNPALDIDRIRRKQHVHQVTLLTRVHVGMTFGKAGKPERANQERSH